MKWWAREETGRIFYILIHELQYRITLPSGYIEIQSTKPQTLYYLLVDSRIGQLAWILDKTHHLVHTHTFSDEEVITWAMMFIIPGTSAQASIYTAFRDRKDPRGNAQFWFNNPIIRNQDFGASLFPKEVVEVPRVWAEATIAKRIVSWNVHDEGGHFPAVERPEDLQKDNREFTKGMDKGRLAA